MPAEARNNFPELLVLGPEQLKVIQESEHHNRCVLVGEAGCGKTFILLYMLYKNTSKHLSESDCKKVFFVIPEAKTELKAFVEKFVENYCNHDYVQIQPFESFDYFSNNRAIKPILFDEIYGSFLSDNFVTLSHVSAKIVVALGLFDGKTFGLNPDKVFPKWTIFHLWSSYRNPSNISSLCKKLRLLADKKWAFSNPVHLNNALDSSLRVNDENSIQIKHIDYCSEIGKEIEERKEETLLVADDENAYKSEFLNKYTLRVHVNFSDYKFLVRTLSFTGVQYQNVVILLMKSTSVNKAILTTLYHSISRSTHRVILLTPDPKNYKTLLAATPGDLKVFEKLRRYQNVPKEDLFLLTNEEERWEALQLTVLGGVCLIETFESRSEASIIRKDTIRFLLKSFPRFENGEILNIVSKKFSDTIGIQQMLIGYIDSAETVSALPNVPGRRYLLELFLNLMPGRDLYTDFVHLTKLEAFNYDAPLLIGASFVWCDRKMFLLYVDMTRNALHVFSHRLAELSSQLPENMKEHFKCVELTLEQIIDIQEAEHVFAECSAVTEDGKMKNLFKEMNSKWNVAFSCCKISTKLTSGSDSFAQTFRAAFCNLVRIFFKCLSYNCVNHRYYDNKLLDEIKNHIPITTDGSIQILQDSVAFSNSGFIDSESNVKRMCVLLVRVFVKNPEDSNQTDG